MNLNPQTSIGISLATAAVVWAVFQSHMPTVADVRASNASPAIDSSRKSATWEAAGIVAGISLLAKDPTIFIVGGAMVIALDFTHRTAHATDPNTNKLMSQTSYAATATS